jgi:hypothetical protein
MPNMDRGIGTIRGGGHPSRRPLRTRGLLRVSGILLWQKAFPLILRRRHQFRRRLEGCDLGITFPQHVGNL